MLMDTNGDTKILLLKDLCSRLPYGVIVKYWSREGDGDVKLGFGNIGYVFQLGNGWWKECKPYLRPMSSMSRDEWYEFEKNEEEIDNHLESITAQIEWLNKHHFDYRGLIEKGLALEAPKDMYKF